MTRRFLNFTYQIIWITERISTKITQGADKPRIVIYRELYLFGSTILPFKIENAIAPKSMVIQENERNGCIYPAMRPIFTKKEQSIQTARKKSVIPAIL